MKISDITKISVCTALLCVSGMLAIPVPFSHTALTLQVFAVILTAIILSPKKAFFAVLAYLLIGFIGVPVFSGMTGGFQCLFTVSGGFLVSFIVAVPLVSACKGIRLATHIVSAVFVGIPVIYVISTLYNMLVIGFSSVAETLTVTLPFLPFDIVKSVAAGVIGHCINRTLSRAGINV